MKNLRIATFNVNGIKPLMAKNIEISNFINQRNRTYVLQRMQEF